MPQAGVQSIVNFPATAEKSVKANLNFIFTILTAVTVSVAARTVGALIISSMMVVPVACSMQFGKSYKQTVVYAACFAVFFMVTGLFVAYYARLKPGGTILLIGVLCPFY